jgi:hypothetical protein
MLTVSQSAGITYRSKCLPEPKAVQFAKCVAANPRFTEVAIEKSGRAKSASCWFVTFKPVSEERQAAMFACQQTSREERALSEGSAYVWALDKDGGRAFWWLMSASGEVYELDIQGRSCSCPDYTYRCQGAGLECKHIQALRQGLGRFEGFEPVPANGVPEDAVDELDAWLDAREAEVPEPEPALDGYDSWSRCGKCDRLTEPRELAQFRGYCANCWLAVDECCARLR